MLKKAFSWLLVFISVFAVPLHSMAANDTTPLILKNTWINSTEFSGGGTIEMTFTIETDYESGPASDADITLAHSSNKTIHSMMQYEGNNTYQFSFPSSGMLKGTWYVSDITLRDQAGNISTYGSDHPLIQKLRFTIVDGETDSNPPKLTSVKIMQASATPGQTVKLIFGITDESGFSHGSFSLKHKETGSYPLFGNIYFNETTNQYEADLPIPDLAKNGEYTVDTVELTDKKGNTQRYWAHAAPFMDDDKLIITGGISDFKGPMFHSIALSKTTVYPGDRIMVTVKAEDDGRGIKEVNVSFSDDFSGYSRGHSFWGSLRSYGLNEWAEYITVPPQLPDGTYYIYQISLTDLVGNTTFVKEGNQTKLPLLTVLPFFAGVEPTTIVKGAAFDPLAGVKAYSETEGDRTKDIQIKGTVDTATNGVYLLTYAVTSNIFPNSSILEEGNYVYRSYRWVTVNDAQTNPSSDTLYFNEDVKIGVPESGVLELSTGRSTQALNQNTVVSKEGAYEIRVRANNPTTAASRLTPALARGLLAANASPKAQGKQTVKFVIDKKKPNAPTLDPVFSESAKMTGKTEAFATVKIYINGQYYKSVKADSKGAYFSALPKQAAGSEIKVQAVDLAGNASGFATRKVVYAPQVNPVSNRSTAVSGKTLPRATVKVYVNGRLYKTGRADAKGNYKIPIAKLPAGAEIKVVAIDTKKNSYSSLPLKVSDRIAPAPPRVNKVTAQSTAVTGSGEKRATVFVFVGSKQLASGKVTSSGTFKLNIPKQKKGTTLTVYLVDAANNKSAAKYIKVQ
ncbi:Ig-like domain-containing protein [Anoxybacteroides tepidamans]|uniref:Ig-like domain-containing protein n=1 Tax=Anoxybacteroides tepidamans TaxID=265948 RepID=UPI000487722C|nr:Ig-like domain-containing protein [Anoxybacillus tepidamans]